MRTFENFVVDKCDPYIGVEVELENCPIHSIHTAAFQELWHCSGDGSLRGEHAIEMKFKEPYDRARWLKAVSVFDRAMKKVDPYRTPRCSTHVHVNVKGFQTITVSNFITMALMLEPALFTFVDSARESSVFCKPSWDTGSTVYSRVGPVLIGAASMADLAMHSHKYSGINLHSMHTHGSVEFRMAPAVRDAAEMIFWINSCISVWGASLLYTAPPATWLESFLSDYKQNVQDIYPSYEFNDEELFHCEQRASIAFKMLSYYGGF